MTGLRLAIVRARYLDELAEEKRRGGTIDQLEFVEILTPVAKDIFEPLSRQHQLILTEIVRHYSHGIRVVTLAERLDVSRKVVNEQTSRMRQVGLIEYGDDYRLRASSYDFLRVTAVRWDTKRWKRWLRRHAPDANSATIVDEFIDFTEKAFTVGDQ